MFRILALGLGLLVLPVTAVGQGHVDVKDWLGRPGVRLVAVEFYASTPMPGCGSSR